MLIIVLGEKMFKNFLVHLETFLQKPFRLKLFFALSFILFAMIIVAISFIVHYTYETKYMQKNIKESAERYIRLHVETMNKNLMMQKRNLLSLSQNKTFNDYVIHHEDKNVVISIFHNIINSNKDMMQIRYIDKEGRENIRLQRLEPNGQISLTKENLLQDKSDRYYFQEAKKIKEPQKVWISDIDLNMENNEIERPFVPTIRFALPLYTNKQFNGVLIINVFMQNLLEQLTTSDLFLVSLLDKKGNFLIGKDERGDEVLDYSWSKYRNPDERIDTSHFAPLYIQQILNSYKFSTNTLFSEQISSHLGLVQNLILVLKVKQETLNEIKDNMLHKIIYTLAIVLLISGPIGLFLAFIPSLLAGRLLETTEAFEAKNLLFDEYLSAMNINNIITKGDKKGNITYVNDNFCKVTGYTREEALGKPHSILRDPSTLKETFKMMWLTIQAGKIWRGFLRNRKKNGGYYDVDIAIVPILDKKGQILEYLAIRHDITELMEQRKSLLEIATTDQLTNVGNRYKLMYDISQHVINNLAIVDINGFSLINDLYGHNIGDELIIKFSHLLEQNLTKEYQLYRLHADKFAILNASRDFESFVDFISKLNTLLLASTIKTELKEFDIVTTAGISSKDNKILLSTAEIANKYAKEINKTLLIYSQNLNIESKFEENIKWTEKIKRALIEERFLVFYQPLYNNVTNKIEKYESLIRMKDTDGSIISPIQFLDIAKSSGQYIDITKFVIQESFKKFESIPMSFSINFTIEDILDDELVHYFESMLDTYKVAHKLIIEIVESEGIKQFDRIIKFIRRVKDRGCRVGIDDFGTGYSNFEYLIKLEADFIKIDGSMIKNINTDKNTKEIVSTIISFAKKMQYKTVAEFVASKEILETVKELGIDFSQGFYIGKPEPELVFEVDF